MDSSVAGSAAGVSAGSAAGVSAGSVAGGSAGGSAGAAVRFAARVFDGVRELVYPSGLPPLRQAPAFSFVCTDAFVP